MSLLRVAAALVALCAVVLLNGTTHEKVVVVVLEGARLDVLKDPSSSARLPNLRALMATGVGGELRASDDARSADAIVWSLFAGETRGLDAGRATPAWTRLARSSRPSVIVGVEGTQETLEQSGAIVLPGPRAAQGFFGSNLGLTTNRDQIERGQTPWPYSLISADLAAASEALGAGDVSPWIELPIREDAGKPAAGVTRVYALDEDVVYLSPVYLNVSRAPGVGDLYVGDDPSFVVTSSRAGEYLPRHASDLANSRLDVGTAIARARDWDLLVYVDRRVALAEAVDGAAARAAPFQSSDSSESPNRCSDAAFEEADEAIARLRALAGPRSVVVVVGIHSDPEADDIGWYAISSSSSRWARATVDELRATLDHLLAIPRADDTVPIAAVVAAHPVRRATRRARGEAEAQAVVPLTTGSLREFSSAAIDNQGIATAASAP